ncbi:MAG: hypothetical protein QUS33_04125 [Dehalococcoidia bacterium]|nr:hypothetical protein [Dehalococcoidia bacterium]
MSTSEERHTVLNTILQYAKQGVLPMLSIVATGLAIHDAVKEVRTWGLPSWAWFTIGYVFLAVSAGIYIREQAREIRRINDDPHTEWRRLSKEAKEIVNDLNQEVSHSIDTVELPLEGLRKCISVLMEQVAYTDLGRIEDMTNITDVGGLKEWVDGFLKSGARQIEQKSHPFQMIAGSFSTTMNQCGIGIESITTATYKGRHEHLREIVKERAGSDASKAYQHYFTAHNLYYSLKLFSQYAILLFQHVEALPSEARAEFHELETFLAALNSMASAISQRSQLSLDITEATLIEAIAGQGKETGGQSY